MSLQTSLNLSLIDCTVSVFSFIIKTNNFFNWKKLFVVFCVLFLSQNIAGQTIKRDSFVENILKNHQEALGFVSQHPEKYKLQIIYTQIDRDKNNNAHFTTHSYRANKNNYFYPASTIKVFAAALALEKINDLNSYGLNKYSIMLTDSTFSGQSKVAIDSTAENLKPSIAQYIRKIFVVSDNDAYNRLYEFIGQEAFNKKLHEKGFSDIQIAHRLSISLTPEENKNTNAIRFYDRESGQLIYEQPAEKSTKNYQAKDAIYLGKGFDNGTDTIQPPMDFSLKNRVTLVELHKVIRTILFPESIPENERFRLTEDDYIFLKQYMSQLPRETSYPNYSNYEIYPDNYCKFFMYGISKEKISSNIRIFNKIGLAYGFTIDNAYIVDFDKNIEFMLSAVIYTNENEILNDGKYEYEKTSYPFMDALGDVFYEYEMQRNRKYQPDLQAFKMNYDKE